MSLYQHERNLRWHHGFQVDLNSRVGVQLESTGARGVTTGMIDDLWVVFKTLHVRVALLKQVFLL